VNIGQHQDAARIPGAGSGIEVELQARFQDGIGAVKSERQAKATFSRLQDDVTPHRVQVAMNARDGDLKSHLLLGGAPHHIDACRRLGVRIGRQGGFEFQERIFQHLDIAIDKEGERPAGPDLVNVCVPRVGFVAERNVPHTRTVAAEDGFAGETRDWRNSAASEALPLTMTSMIAERSRHASSQAATTF
jgi:hypothetical protein